MPIAHGRPIALRVPEPPAIVQERSYRYFTCASALMVRLLPEQERPCVARGQTPFIRTSLVGPALARQPLAGHKGGQLGPVVDQRRVHVAAVHLGRLPVAQHHLVTVNVDRVQYLVMSLRRTATRH